ncbi:MAG: hypothetical protein JSU91_07720 [Thermoplasmatales archaeon]|nr:MAG: hypothetical protein JSU91_07720 [Thermoplasmatales archaeon]
MFISIAISPIINAYTFNKDDTKFIQKTSDVVYNDGDKVIICEILKRLGIFLEELYKNFPEGTIIYPFLVIMMLPVILLWNNFCDEYVISYDLSLTGNLQINHNI